MNAFVNLKPILTPAVADRDWLAWPEILERQQALDTPAWMADWLEAAHQPLGVSAADASDDIWPETAECQDPIDTPNWQAEWLDWIDSVAAAKHSTQAAPTPLVRPISAARNLGASPRNTLPWLLSKQVEEDLEIAA